MATCGDPQAGGGRNVAAIPEAMLRGDAMEAAFSGKQTILETLRTLPEDATIEEAMERLSSRLRPDRFACGS